MTDSEYRSTRRQFLTSAGRGAVGVAATGAFVGGLGSRLGANEAGAATTSLSLVATDGYVSLPNYPSPPVYVFGFVQVPGNLTVSQLITQYKGRAQISAPTLDFKQEDDVKITLTNLGLIQRPDLTDSHTLHWHGFDIPSPLNDGVPEVSVAVPIGKQLTYFYRPHREGTYMWHCHFEDVEHVQMGMTGIVFVRPTQENGTSHGGFTKFAYNDGNTGLTGYNRHFAILENEIWSVFHDGDRDIQESIPTNYDPQWFTLNGRVFPETTFPNDTDTQSSGLTTHNPNYETDDRSQPNSALIQVNAGDSVLLRLANLGYRQNAMELPGITMRVVGQDASYLGGESYDTNTIYMGPGEARDVLFTAPAYDPARPGPTGGGLNTYNVYYFKNRDWRKLSNYGASGAGGMQTEVRVYPAGTLPAQTVVSQTYV